MPATHSTEHTGSAILDRIQANVGRLVSTVQAMLQTAEARRTVSLWLKSDFTCTEATAQSTKLGFAVNKGECWDVAVVAYGANSNVAGMKYAIACPDGSEATGELESSSSNTAVANWTTQALGPSALSAATHVGASNAPRPDRINLRIYVGASGFIVLQAASATAGTTTTVSAKSHLYAIKATAL